MMASALSSFVQMSVFEAMNYNIICAWSTSICNAAIIKQVLCTSTFNLHVEIYQPGGRRALAGYTYLTV